VKATLCCLLEIIEAIDRLRRDLLVKLDVEYGLRSDDQVLEVLEDHRPDLDCNIVLDPDFCEFGIVLCDLRVELDRKCFFGKPALADALFKLSLVRHDDLSAIFN